VVREAVRQHSLDEAIHHLLFREAMRFVWPAATAQEKLVRGGYFRNSSGRGEGDLHGSEHAMYDFIVQ
jgi:hypothetical protein